MREWLLIICASTFCAETPTALQVSEGQCREVIRIADEMRELNRRYTEVGQKDVAENLRAFCISPDGKTRLDSWPSEAKAK